MLTWLERAGGLEQSSCAESRPIPIAGMRPSSKIFNDPIHGHIELSGLSVGIIDTPQFQRLRDVSQLGGAYYVFPGAASRRFEHSLGVSHLARHFVDTLRAKQPELGITDEDALCVEVAGLCHDLGHGPFSHLYDGRFLPIINHNHDFAHEHASIGIFDLLIRENNLEPSFALFGLNEDDIHFIKELMLGDKHDGPPGFLWRGRGNKTFLYDIVANKRNGIDVDKFDYFARDCHVLGVTKSFDSSRLMRFAMYVIERGVCCCCLEMSVITSFLQCALRNVGYSG
jgi:HD superfamily phosphohydrolase